MRSKRFAIKVAFLGHVSAGKTTLLNAILGEKFSEVSMKRTTAGVSHFIISPYSRDTTTATTSENLNPHATITKNKEFTNDIEKDVQLVEDMSPKSSKDTLAEISADNVALRSKDTVEEKTFLIELKKPLFEMRPDTQLVFTDVPGLNEAGSSNMYLDYVKKAWDGFDCVIVVMDGTQGMNSEESLSLLQFIKGQMEKNKSIPLIVVCNKVDDTDNQELMGLVQELREEVIRVFNHPVVQHKSTPTQAFSLGKKLTNTTSSSKMSFFPNILHMSARNAFLCRVGTNLTMEKFLELDESYIREIGMEECRAEFRKVKSKEEKYKLVHKIVSDPAVLEDRMDLTNFKSFLEALSFYIDGAEKQDHLLWKQIELRLSKLDSDVDFERKLNQIHDDCVAMGIKVDYVVLETKFEDLFREQTSAAFASFKSSPTQLSSLYKPMENLIEYSNSNLFHRIQASKGVLKESRMYFMTIEDKMKELVRNFCEATVENQCKNSEPSTAQQPAQNVSATERATRKHTTENKKRVCKNQGVSHGMVGNSSTRVKVPLTGGFGPPTQQNVSSPFGAYPKMAQAQHQGGGLFGSTQQNVSSGAHSKMAQAQQPTGFSHVSLPFGAHLNTAQAQQPSNTEDSNLGLLKKEVSAMRWTDLTAKDCNLLNNSILSMRYNRHFCENFGKAIGNLCWLLDPRSPMFHSRRHDLPSNSESNFTGPGTTKKSTSSLIMMPDSPKDPNHWGHLVWLYCNWINWIETRK